MSDVFRPSPRSTPALTGLFLASAVLTACGPSDSAPEPDAPAMTETTAAVPDIQATNGTIHDLVLEAIAAEEAAAE